MPDLTISGIEIDTFLTEYNAARSATDHLSLDDPRRYLLMQWQDARACPGSGKTTILAVKLLLLAAKWVSPHKGICVLTHTNVACDEIRDRLIGHPTGHRFQTYPHFIGTIQDFVHRFLALPYIRSKGLKVHRVDDAAAIGYMMRRANPLIICFFEKRNQSLGAIAELKILQETGLPEIPGFDKKSNAPAYKAMEDLLTARLKDGVFFYSEMYHYAKKCVAENPAVVPALRMRFPAVFADEMQDTSDYQDDLLCELFDCAEVKFQRVGDPDQAIYGAMGEGKQNTSFNDAEDHHIIGTTHRFCNSISRKIVGLSVGRLNQIDSLVGDNRVNYPHTVLLFDNDSKAAVLDAFAAILAEEDPECVWRTVKAVGANDGEGGFIRQYWSAFEKRQAPATFKPRTLREAVSRDWDRITQHTGERYSVILRAVIDLLRYANVRRIGTNSFHTEATLIALLKAKSAFVSFRKLMARWIEAPPLEAAIWAADITALGELIEVNVAHEDIAPFVAFELPVGEAADLQPNAGNLYTAGNGRTIDVGTIHSVKGETHDATLVLETQYFEWDFQHVLDHLALIDTKVFKLKRKTRAARLLYVGMSRPRHLLCIAMHKDHISDDQQKAMEALGWRFRAVGAEVPAEAV